MICRCHKPGEHGYEDYGAKGIYVCAEWRANRNLSFLWSILNGFSPDLTLDRKDNFFGYSPANCRWVTQEEQQKNRRLDEKLECGGIVKNMKEWGREVGMEPRLIQARLQDGWTPEQALGLERRIRTGRVRSIL
jgi:hypothetical protein